MSLHKTENSGEAMTDKGAITRAELAIQELNAAIDEFWNSPEGLQLTGMGEKFVKKITAAQNECMYAKKDLQSLKDAVPDIFNPDDFDTIQDCDKHNDARSAICTRLLTDAIKE